VGVKLLLGLGGGRRLHAVVSWWVRGKPLE